jgi:WD40 repeat protein
MDADPIGIVPGTRTLVTRTAGLPARDSPGDIPAGPLRFWDADTGRTGSWFAADDLLPLVRLSPDGRWALVDRTAGPDGAKLQLFEIATGRAVADLPRRAVAPAGWAVFSPDGRWIAFDGPGPELDIWDIAQARERPGPPDAGNLWVFSPDGQWLAYVTLERRPAASRIVLWDVAAGRPGLSWLGPAQLDCLELQFAPDGRTLVGLLNAAESRHEGPWRVQVCAWDAATGQERFRADSGMTYFPPQAPWLTVTGLGERGFHRLTYDTGQECGRLTLTPDDSNFVWVDGLSPDGRYLAVGALVYNAVLLRLNALWPKWPEDRLITQRIKLVNVATGQTTAVLPSAFDWGRRDAMARTRFAPDGATFAVVTDDHIEIWDVPPRKPLTWLAVAAAVLALPPAWLARRRVRRLRRRMA